MGRMGRMILYVTLMLSCILSGGICFGQQIETPGTVRAMRDLLPTLDDLAADKILHDDRVIFWTSQTMGVAYQAHSGDQPGQGPIGFADSAASGRRNQNTADRFPWAPKPGGTHRATNSDSYKGIWLPMDDVGNLYPVVWYRHRLEGLARPRSTVIGYNWSFPVGTVIWEILTQRHESEVYVWEVRSRWRHADHWRPRVFRPFPRAIDAAEAILSRPRSELGAAFVDDCFGPIESSARISSTGTGNPEFGTIAGDAFTLEFPVDSIPPLPPSLVADLLDSTPFVDVQGAQWKPGCSSPVSSHPFHLVPPGALVPIVGGDEDSCARCHNSSLTSSERFGKTTRRWGWVRGNHGEESGGILSFHPVDPRTFAGRAKANPEVEMRRAWVAGGVVAKFNRWIHKTRYNRLIPEHLEQTQ